MNKRSQTFPLYVLIAVFSLGSLLVAPIVYATGNPENILGALTRSGQAAETTGVEDVSVVIGGIVGTALSFVGLFLSVLILYAGYLWMTARGDEEKVKKAQKILGSSLAGFFVVITSYAITVAVGAQLNKPSTGSAPGTPGTGCCSIQDLDDASNDVHQLLTRDECDARDFEPGLNTQFDPAITDTAECTALDTP